MNARGILVGAGGTAAFAAIVGAGALAIVSMAPSERVARAPESGLLIENLSVSPLPSLQANAPRAASARPAPPPPRVPALREPVPEPPQAEVAEPVDTPPAPAPTLVPVPRRPVRRAEPPAPAESAPAAPQLASREPAPATPPVILPTLRRPPPPDPRLEGVLTPAEIRKLKLSLRLTPEQEVNWPPVEQVLSEIGAQQLAAVKAGQKASDAFGGGTSMKVFFAARPLIASLREDQKAPLRQRARAMGYGSIASSI